MGAPLVPPVPVRQTHMQVVSRPADQGSVPPIALKHLPIDQIHVALQIGEVVVHLLRMLSVGRQGLVDRFDGVSQCKPAGEIASDGPCKPLIESTQFEEDVAANQRPLLQRQMRPLHQDRVAERQLRRRRRNRAQVGALFVNQLDSGVDNGGVGSLRQPPDLTLQFRGSPPIVVVEERQETAPSQA